MPWSVSAILIRFVPCIPRRRHIRGGRTGTACVSGISAGASIISSRARRLRPSFAKRRRIARFSVRTMVRMALRSICLWISASGRHILRRSLRRRFSEKYNAPASMVADAGAFEYVRRARISHSLPFQAFPDHRSVTMRSMASSIPIAGPPPNVTKCGSNS